MTLPLPNMQAALVDKLGKIIPPWNSWFQQFTQQAPAPVYVTVVGPSPFFYTANANGTVYIQNDGTVSFVSLVRGLDVSGLNTVLPLIIPVSIGDTVVMAYTVAPTFKFLGA